MPKLPTYTAKLDGGGASGGRRATAEDMGSVDLTGKGGLVRTVQDAAEGFLQAKEEDESRKVLVSQAEIRAKYAKRLDEAVTNGEDIAKIREELDNDLSGVTEKLTTKKGAETAQLHAANNGAIFDNQASSILVSRAWSAAVIDGTKFANALGDTVARDPSSLAQAEADADTYAATLTKVPAEKRAELANKWKNDLNVTAAMSAIRSNPDAAKKRLEDGEWNLSRPQRESALDEVEKQKRALRVDAELQRTEKERIRQENSEAALDTYYKQLKQGGFSMTAALNDPVLTRQAREHIVERAERTAKENAGEGKRSNMVVLNDLYLRYTAPEGTPGKLYTADAIYEASKRGDLNTRDDAFLRSIVASNKDENGRTINTRINGMNSDFGRELSTNIKVQSMSMADPGLASEIQSTYSARVMQRIEVLRKANESPSQVFDVDSKQFVGSREFKQGVINEVMAQKRPQVLDAKVAAGVMEFPDGSLRKWNGKEPKTNSANWTVVESGAVRQIPK